MKILAGELKGRVLIRPKSPLVRPMGDKVRAALFDIVGPLSGLSVLDVYAGSGAIGFEALSRGAALVEAIEGNVKVARLIEQNAKQLELDWGYQLWVMTVEKWLAARDSRLGTAYDLIVADPPYARIQADVLDKLGGRLKPGGVLIVSHSSRIKPSELESVLLFQTKKYGDSSVSFYRN